MNAAVLISESVLMRFDTIKISAYLVYLIQAKRPQMEVIDDGGDIVHVRLASGDEVMIYFIESDISDYELLNIINANSTNQIHSLFILWRDLLLPQDGMYYIPDDWMAVLLTLHSDKIYAFDAYGADVFIFPIHFEGTGFARDIRHGDAIELNTLTTKRVKTRYADHNWYVANFEISQPTNVLQVYFEMLGINPSTDRQLIKRAYRYMARKLHPDMNDHDAATLSEKAEITRKMQQLNEAYQKILAHLDAQKN